MKIQKNNGQWWNDDNNCWTSSEYAATDLDPNDLPSELNDGGDVDDILYLESEGLYYTSDGIEPTAAVQ